MPARQHQIRELTGSSSAKPTSGHHGAIEPHRSKITAQDGRASSSRSQVDARPRISQVAGSKSRALGSPRPDERDVTYASYMQSPLQSPRQPEAQMHTYGSFFPSPPQLNAQMPTNVYYSISSSQAQMREHSHGSRRGSTPQSRTQNSTHGLHSRARTPIDPYHTYGHKRKQPDEPQQTPLSPVSALSPNFNDFILFDTESKLFRVILLLD